ncbi:MAG: VCBS repeat-containing protein [Planctomycetes bacterium]|nr:VCBS repeat-containing protein [Planctomycetota bacterium]
MRMTSFMCLVLAAFVALSLVGCTRSEESTKPETPRGTASPSQAAQPPADAPADYATPRTTLLLTQAQFVDKVDPQTGQSNPVPGPARLVLLRQHGEQWRRDVLEDPESNVFHKVAWFTDPGAVASGPGLLTIGAQAAALKLWRHTGDKWTAETLWKTEFGGRWNRLRDFEIGDVTGDKQLDIVIATHDQGVVAVLTRAESGWQAQEIDRQPQTFVHEIELGDLDGDAQLEIYATPSAPNRLDGTPQPGLIPVYRHTAGGFQRAIVEEFPYRHVKEILVADLGDGPALFAALEAEEGTRPDQPADAGKTAIKRYRFQDGKYAGEIVATLPDRMCRFLNAGDVDGDGKPELIVSPLKSGVWLIRPGPTTPWKTECIDRNSGGFDHPTALADLDGDGTLEIYVAADDQRAVRRYRWTGSTWDRQELYQMEKDKITWFIAAAKF